MKIVRGNRTLFGAIFGLLLVSVSHAQSGCITPMRTKEILDAAKAKGLQTEALDIVPLPELRDSFIAIEQASPDLRLLGSMCFYSLRKEVYSFDGSAMPTVTLDLGQSSQEWYLASSPGKIYALRGFDGATENFNRMMVALDAKVDSVEAAEAVFDLYVRATLGQEFRSQIIGDELKLIAVAADDFRLRYPIAKRAGEFRRWLRTRSSVHSPLHPPKAHLDGSKYPITYFRYSEGHVEPLTIVVDRQGGIADLPQSPAVR